MWTWEVTLASVHWGCRDERSGFYVGRAKSRGCRECICNGLRPLRHRRHHLGVWLNKLWHRYVSVYIDFFFLAQLELNLWEVNFTSQSIREKNPVNMLLITVFRLSYWPVLGRYKSTTQESPFWRLLESTAFSWVTHKSRHNELLWGNAADCFEKRCKLEIWLRTVDVPRR